MSIKIVSDSSINMFRTDGPIPYTTVPLKIRIDETEFVDREGIDTADMVARMKTSSKPSTTSCPNAYEWMEAFEGADNIFVVTISANLSGSYAAAMQAKDMYLEEHPEAKIHVINSKATGATMRLIVRQLENCLSQGMTFETTKAFINDYMNHVKILFALESLMNLAKNGRCPMAFAKIAGLLGIRFLGKASDEGTIQQSHICRGHKRTIRTTVEEMQRMGYQGGAVHIDHCLNPASAEDLRNAILAVYPEAPVTIGLCTGLCSYYAEEGGMIIGFDDLPRQ